MNNPSRFPIALILLVVAFCGACVAHHEPSRAYYLSQPFRGDSVTVYFDERSVIWMNAMAREARMDMQEVGSCLHIARQEGDTAFWVDSLELPAHPVGASGSTWSHTQFLCPPETAPVHWHVVMAEMLPVLQALARDANLPDSLPRIAVRDRCTLSDADVAGYWARYPFVAMMCGVGRDSILVRRVRRR